MTLQEIKDQVINDKYPNLDVLLRFESASITTQLELWPEVCRRAQLECARETLKEAAENAVTINEGTYGGHGQTIDHYVVDKSTVTDKKNIKLIE